MNNLEEGRDENPAIFEVVKDKQEFNEILGNIEELNITLEKLNEAPVRVQKIRLGKRFRALKLGRTQQVQSLHPTGKIILYS